jgi:hypothetical protein
MRGTGVHKKPTHIGYFLNRTHDTIHSEPSPSIDAKGVKSEDISRPVDNPIVGWRSLAVFAIVVLCLVAVFGGQYWQERHQRLRETWPAVKGIPTGTRVVKEPPTQRFPITMYVGQCSVEYFVQGKRYSVWAASGYLDPDPKFVSDRMGDCPASDYVVRYNPHNPSEAYGERQGGPP